MFVYLSKLLPLFIYPLGLGCILLIIVLASEKHKKLRRGLLISALVILWLGSNRWVSFGLARSLEWRNLPPETPATGGGHRRPGRRHRIGGLPPANDRN